MGFCTVMCPQIQARGRQHFVHLLAAAQRALNEPLPQLPLKVVFRAKPAFKQVLVLALQVKNLHSSVQAPKVSTMALAHKAIKPPGNKPTTKSNKAFTPSTTRTSLGAETVEAVMGSSKYITLTTRK